MLTDQNAISALPSTFFCTITRNSQAKTCRACLLASPTSAAPIPCPITTSNFAGFPGTDRLETEFRFRAIRRLALHYLAAVRLCFPPSSQLKVKRRWKPQRCTEPTHADPAANSSLAVQRCHATESGLNQKADVSNYPAKPQPPN